MIPAQFSSVDFQRIIYPGNMWVVNCDYIVKLTIPPRGFEQKKVAVADIKWTRLHASSMIMN